MIKRIVEISSPARLSVKNRQLLVEREGLDDATVPIEDLGVLILDHPAIMHTQALLSSCAENNVAVVVCGSRHLPASLLVPFEANTLHSRTISMQAKLTGPVRKKLWRRIIRAKINAQAGTLEIATGGSGPLKAFAKRVRSGDPDNMEARAAREYWGRLFGKAFRRDTDEPGINAMLNYGYAVMRSAVARAIVGAGLHPALGIHHRNQYNAFCLADDLVEPLRPITDLAVYKLCEDIGSSLNFTPEVKRALLNVLATDCVISGAKLPMLEALQRYAASVRGAICGETKNAEIPVI